MHRAALLLAVLTASGGAQDWPDFRGPERDGIYPGAIAERLPGGGPEVLWEKQVGAGFANPVVANGRLILFHRMGSNEVVEALDAATGKPVWKHEYPTSYHDDFGFDPGPRASPVIAGGQVYTFGAEGVLTCLSFATGKPIWQVKANEKYGVSKGFFGAASTPLIDGNRLFQNLGGSEGAGIIALDKDTGKLLWKATEDGASYSSPVMARIQGKRRLVFFTREGLAVLEPEDGKVVYSRHWRSRSNASVNAAMPVVSGDVILLTASYGTGALALDFSGGGEPKELWSGEEALSSHYSTPVLKDGVVYGYDGRQEYGQSFRAIDLAGGKVLWSEDGFGAGTVTLAGGILVLLREKGELTLARANPKKFEPLSRARILSRTVRAYPALADGRLFARDESTLVCVRLN
jgi:outer membrane protein assembly factor BamB